MNILFVGDKQTTEEMQTRIGTNGPVHYISPDDVVADYSAYSLIIDTRLEIADSHYTFWDVTTEYSGADNALVLLGMTKDTLAALSRYISEEELSRFARFNSLPSFINRPIWEVATANDDAAELVKNRLKQLNVDYRLVADRVGLVMPRIICMIINEAFYTLQEGTATEQDIDLSMKLGANYPYGPFEWLQIIGIKNVYTLLEELYSDTRDERYKICPLLKRRFLLS